MKLTIKNNLKLFYNSRALCLAGLLSAMSIILGKYLQIPTPFQEILRISFENLPILLAGIVLGPFVGGTVGIIADLIGCLLYGYTINPIVTLGAFSVGFVSGLTALFLKNNKLTVKVGVSVFSAHVAGSVIIKTFGLAAWYLNRYEIGTLELMAWRALNYLIIGIAEALIIYLLLRHKGFSNQIRRMLDK